MEETYCERLLVCRSREDLLKDGVVLLQRVGDSTQVSRHFQDLGQTKVILSGTMSSRNVSERAIVYSCLTKPNHDGVIIHMNGFSMKHAYIEYPKPCLQVEKPWLCIVGYSPCPDKQKTAYRKDTSASENRIIARRELIQLDA